ncbi:MAG: XrtA system polysaccharide deacetylase [Candidatus Binatia bacterium]
MRSDNVTNALSIDLEDWYQVSDFTSIIPFAEWGKYEHRLRRSTEKILQLLDRYGVKATFFVLTWNAEHEPELVKELHAAGHEISSHGYSHQLVYRQTADEFAEDLRRSVRVIEDLTGEKVRGYRAPSFSITAQSLWALDVLVQQGFQYDSSVFPIHRSLYGIPAAERFPHVIKQESGKRLVEFPISTVRVGKWNIPFSGGAYLRALPKAVISFLLKRINTEGRPGIVYFHPWEIDPDQPRLTLPQQQKRTMHYINLKTTERKLEHLLRRFRFAPIRDVLSLS